MRTTDFESFCAMSAPKIFCFVWTTASNCGDIAESYYILTRVHCLRSWQTCSDFIESDDLQLVLRSRIELIKEVVRSVYNFILQLSPPDVSSLLFISYVRAPILLWDRLQDHCLQKVPHACKFISFKRQQKHIRHFSAYKSRGVQP